LLQSFCPAAAQAQVLLEQVAPVGQAVHPPQCAGVPSPVAGTHAPSGHKFCVQVAEHVPLLHDWPDGQAVHDGPQF
jgi:hypothetical protein